VRPRTVRMYQRSDGVVPFERWYDGLRDKRGQQKILARIARLNLGNLGDNRSVGQGVFELRIAFGPGYRVYIGQDGQNVVILLVGGDKGTQDEDIKKAKAYWKTYQEARRYAES
jgi:putative addiction module killer protein